MGVSIDAICAVVVPFTDYELVKESHEEVRYNQYTGAKEVSTRTTTNLKYNGEIIEEGFWELGEILRTKTGLELYKIGDNWESPVYLGKCISSMDAKRGDPPRKTSHKDLNAIFEEVKDKMKKAGYGEVEPILLNFLRYG